MMHGYLAFGASNNPLVPLLTWRDTTTGQAAAELTDLFGVNIPLRWSVAHYRQALLDAEPHVPRVRHLTTLAGYVHWQLTGERVLGVGDASGMFPIGPGTGDYDSELLKRFDLLTGPESPALGELLPRVLAAGRPAGVLTEQGSALLDPTGTLHAGIPCCPPEGDAGTGMVATNSVAPRSGNVSVGTSVFAMVVLERALQRVHDEVDVVTTPAGDPVAMVHCNNGASELGAWAKVFGEFAAALGLAYDDDAIFAALLHAAGAGASDCAGMLAYNYLSGEPITDLEEGRPMFLRSPDSRFDLGTFMRTHLFASLATLRIGMDVLLKTEGVRLDRMFAHGGLFKTKGVAQKFLAAAITTPVSVGDVAAEGGAWGIAVLAAFLRDRDPGQDLTDYLATRVFADLSLRTETPAEADVAGFEEFIRRYVAALPVERAAVEHL